MQRWTTIYRNTEEQYLVYDLDEAIRNLRRNHQTPWTFTKKTMRVFSDVLEYPKQADHGAMAYLDNQAEGYGNKVRPYYTSIKEFYEDPNNLSQYAEIWNSGDSYIGIRNKELSGGSEAIDNCELDSDYTISNDFTSKEIDNVIYKTGNGSLRLALINTANTATLEKTFTGIAGSLYKRKYVFSRIYFSSVPTSVTIRFGADSSNYVYKTVTTQFSGQAFVADDWNWVAIDLNNVDGTVGTVDDTTTFSYYAITLAGAASGLYYFDEVSLKQWSLMDYYYYSKYNVKDNLLGTVTKEAFIDQSTNTYEQADELVCPDEFADVVMYDAMLTTISDTENSKIYQVISGKRDDAWSSLLTKYPSMEPVIITHGWRFGSQMGSVVKWYEA